MVSRFAAKLSSTRHCISGIRVADRRWPIVWSDRLTRRLVSHYVAVSENVAQVHSQLCCIPAGQISAIPNGVDLPADNARAAGPADDNLQTILFVGQLTFQKAPLDLLHAYSRLPQKRP